MELLKEYQKKHLKKRPPKIKAGDIVRVSQKIIEGKKERLQTFQGIIIKISGGSGLDATFTVRRKSLGIGIERTFPLHSPLLFKIEPIKSTRVRRAKLYFLRNQMSKRDRLKEKSIDPEIMKYMAEAEVELKREEEEIKEQIAKEALKKEAKKEKAEEELEQKFTQAKSQDNEAQTKKTETKSEDSKEK